MCDKVQQDAGGCGRVQNGAVGIVERWEGEGFAKDKVMGQ